MRRGAAGRQRPSAERTMAAAPRPRGGREAQPCGGEGPAGTASHGTSLPRSPRIISPLEDLHLSQAPTQLAC